MSAPRLFPAVGFYLVTASCILLGACSPEPPPAPAEQPAMHAKRRDPNNYRSDCRDLYAKAFRLDSILLQQLEVDQAMASQAITAFTDYAYYCDNDSLSPVYLIKTAQVARAINNIPQAQKSLQYCVDNYRDFRDRPAALVLLARLYDEPTYLNNRDEARRLYQQVIDEYPGSDWAESARGALALVGKTDEEIIRMLKRRN